MVKVEEARHFWLGTARGVAIGGACGTDAHSDGYQVFSTSCNTPFHYFGNNAREQGYRTLLLPIQDCAFSNLFSNSNFVSNFFKMSIVQLLMNFPRGLQDAHPASFGNTMLLKVSLSSYFSKWNWNFLFLFLFWKKLASSRLFLLVCSTWSSSASLPS